MLLQILLFNYISVNYVLLLPLSKMVLLFEDKLNLEPAVYGENKNITELTKIMNQKHLYR